MSNNAYIIIYIFIGISQWLDDDNSQTDDIDTQNAILGPGFLNNVAPKFTARFLGRPASSWLRS